ncbi:tetratricopeptide repeat protein [Sediminibacillus massiliensis]|uniref:tetratricopeptide repeat protein n=1 Tax=Sediminibacillus massiliensis TaxID=1926277 RepID=UPI000988756B|nr:tetratricopeptide repeat protein [Sediminibacillus massiliensis]
MDKLESALLKRETGQMEDSRQLLLELANENAENGEILFQCGQTHDAMGLEEEAVPYYEKAIEAGLPDETLKDAYVCLGSTYKVLGKDDSSLKVFSKGESLFPEYRPLQVFKSLTLFSMNQHAAALSVVLKALTETTNDQDISKYSRALSYYAEHMDQ